MREGGAQAGRVVIAQADVAHLSGALQAGEGVEGHLDRGAALAGPVDLQQREGVEAEAPEAGLGVGDDVGGREVAAGVAAAVDADADLGGEHEVMAAGAEGPDQALVGAAVDRCGVEPVDAELEGGGDGRAGGGLAGVGAPALTAEGPAAEAERGELQVGAGQGAVLHRGRIGAARRDRSRGALGRDGGELGGAVEFGVLEEDAVAARTKPAARAGGRVELVAALVGVLVPGDREGVAVGRDGEGGLAVVVDLGGALGHQAVGEVADVDVVVGAELAIEAA